MKEVTCIICPNSCLINVEGDVTTGNKCKRGRDFALNEVTNPTRAVTTTVQTVFDSCPVLSVRTDGEISKSLITKLIDELAAVKVDKKLKVGDVVLANALNSGVNVIATKNID